MPLALALLFRSAVCPATPLPPFTTAVATRLLNNWVLRIMKFVFKIRRHSTSSPAHSVLHSTPIHRLPEGSKVGHWLTKCLRLVNQVEAPLNGNGVCCCRIPLSFKPVCVCLYLLLRSRLAYIIRRAPSLKHTETSHAQRCLYRCRCPCGSTGPTRARLPSGHNIIQHFYSRSTWRIRFGQLFGPRLAVDESCCINCDNLPWMKCAKITIQNGLMT